MILWGGGHTIIGLKSVHWLQVGIYNRDSSFLNKSLHNLSYLCMFIYNFYFTFLKCFVI